MCVFLYLCVLEVVFLALRTALGQLVRGNYLLSRGFVSARKVSQTPSCPPAVALLRNSSSPESSRGFPSASGPSWKPEPAVRYAPPIKPSPGVFICNKEVLRANEAGLSVVLGICRWFALAPGRNCFSAIPRERRQRKSRGLEEGEEASSPVAREPEGGKASQINGATKPAALLKGLKEPEK